MKTTRSGGVGIDTNQIERVSAPRKVPSTITTRKLSVHADRRGRLMEILRCDEKVFTDFGFGQVYLTTVYPGVVKAWHKHRQQTDRFAVVAGMGLLVLLEDDGSLLAEYVIGEHNPQLVVIPTDTWHGFKCVGDKETLIINIPDKPYNYEDPDELRVPAHGHFDYDWNATDF